MRRIWFVNRFRRRRCAKRPAHCRLRFFETRVNVRFNETPVGFTSNATISIAAVGFQGEISGGSGDWACSKRDNRKFFGCAVFDRILTASFAFQAVRIAAASAISRMNGGDAVSGRADRRVRVYSDGYAASLADSPFVHGGQRRSDNRLFRMNIGNHP